MRQYPSITALRLPFSTISLCTLLCVYISEHLSAVFEASNTIMRMCCRGISDRTYMIPGLEKLQALS
jgi:hypothetical protein